MEIKDCSQEDRLGFIRKVYSILLSQLIFTTIWSLIVFNSYLLRGVVLKLYWLNYLLLGLIIGIEITLICCRKVARHVPYNYLLLGAFTMAEAWSLSYICI